MENEYILEMRNITKEFPGVKALDNVNFKVRKGEIHCLVGENGAGKSTLMKVLSGVWKYGTYTGDIVYEGEEGFVEIVAKVVKKDSDECYQERADYQAKLAEKAEKIAEREKAAEKAAKKGE